MEAELNKLLKNIGDDFERSTCRDKDDPRRVERAEGFRNDLAIEEGRKYLKVTKKLGTQTMVWGFIMKDDDSKFRKGDILKAASWASPARNKARGNIFEDYDVRWTGPKYL